MSSCVTSLEHKEVSESLEAYEAFSPLHGGQWTRGQVFVFRFVALTFVLLYIPFLDWHFWQDLVHVRWFHYQDVFAVLTYIPQYGTPPRWGVASFLSVGIVALVALSGARAWQTFDRSEHRYKSLYYWLRVLVRYKLALALIAYGLLQVFPIQFPKPTLSDLQTEYGEFLQWKLYYLTNGIAGAGYGQVLGLLEVVAGALLLWRKTVTIGAGVALALLGNIVLANFAYQLGQHVLASVLAVGAFFLLWHDLRRLVDLLILQRRAAADRTGLDDHPPATENIRFYAKAAFGFALVLFFADVAHGYRTTAFPFPEAAGTLPGAEGFYTVREFAVNGRDIPYSLTDPVRWQNVVFEKWNTISIRSNRPLTIATSDPVFSAGSDQRDYEFAGNGGRHFYAYKTDTSHQTLSLDGKNDPAEHLTLHYAVRPDRSLLLTGSDESGNTLRAVLEKTDKQYLLLLGRRKPLTLY